MSSSNRTIMVAVVVVALILGAYYYSQSTLAAAPAIVPITRPGPTGERIVVNQPVRPSRELSGFDFVADPHGTAVYS